MLITANPAKASLSLPAIRGRYLLVTFCLSFYLDAHGRRYLSQLWVKDLVEHFKYLKCFTLASPCRYEEPPKEAMLIDNEVAFAGVQFIDLPAPNSTLEGLKLLPQTIAQLWKAVGETDIVHTGVAGWPIPEGWLLMPMTRLRRKFSFLNVESAFWRLEPGIPHSLKSRVRAFVTEHVNHWCLNSADLTIFTQDQYRRTLLTQSERGYVINASWIDRQTIISDVKAAELWHQKCSPEPKVLRLLFAGRLSSGKGILVLLEAMKWLSAQGVSIELDILGQGDRLEECQTVSQSLQAPVRVQLLGTVPYGAEFFNLLQKYHALVVPTTTDEQPRIVYDAYSQGVPVLASATDGIRACVQDGETGKLVAPSDPRALADLFIWSSHHLDQLAQMGMTSLRKARSLTHQEMHRRRWQILLETLDESHVVGLGYPAGAPPRRRLD